MKTVVLGPRPAELEALLEQRRTRGLDLFDEMWEGVLHMAPAPRATHGIVADELAGALRDAARIMSHAQVPGDNDQLPVA